MRSNKIELLSRELSSAMNELKELRGGRRLGAGVEETQADKKRRLIRESEDMAARYGTPAEICLALLDKGVEYDDFMQFIREYVVEQFKVSTVDEVCARDQKILDGSSVWVDGIITPGNRADVNLDALARVFRALGEGKPIDLHLIGHSKTYDFVHPAWFKKYGEYCRDKSVRIYAPGQKRPDLSIHISASGRKILYGMKFTLSNFVPFSSDIQLKRDLGVGFEYDDSGLMDNVLTADFNTTEKLIQLSKNLASVTGRYNLNADTLEPNKHLLRIALLEESPKQQKAHGRNARLKSAYFEMANGPDVNVFEPIWDDIGTNLLIQALGAMLRIYKGDLVLKDFLQFCIDESITPLEAAVHGEIESQGRKVSYGDMPDDVWGCSITYPWMASWTHQARMPKFKNHLGLGYRLVMDAMDQNSRSVDARTVLGLSPAYRTDRLFSGNMSDLKEKCRQVATNLMQRIFN